MHARRERPRGQKIDNYVDQHGNQLSAGVLRFVNGSQPGVSMWGRVCVFRAGAWHPILAHEIRIDRVSVVRLALHIFNK